MKRILFLSVLFLFAEDDCYTTKTRVVYNQKVEEKSEDICIVTPSIVSFIVSKSCLSKSCPAAGLRDNPVILHDASLTRGSPGFQLCRGIEGVPQIFSYLLKDGKTWRETSRCYLPSSSQELDFVENAYLLDVLGKNVYRKKSDIPEPKMISI